MSTLEHLLLTFSRQLVAFDQKKGVDFSTMGAGHDHKSHSHGGQVSHGKAFAWGIGLNLTFVAVELFYGIAGNSLALVADAGHNFSDVISLVLSWIAAFAASRKPTTRFTYGYRQTSILAALTNALLLLVAIGIIAWEAVERFKDPQPIEGKMMMAVAAIGILINFGTAILFYKGKESDLNIKGAYLHMMADALVSIGVVIAGGGILLTSFSWIDPVVSIVICVVIFLSTWSLLKDSIVLSIAGVPRHIKSGELRNYLSNLKGVQSIHDLHIWAMSTTEVAMTAHLIMPDGHPGDGFLNQVTETLEHDYRISHSTFQIELGNGSNACVLEPEDRV